jgi:hypothetical protein
MRAALATKLLLREGDVRKVLLEEGTGVVEALKAVRGPLFGMFLTAVDAGDSRAATALSGRIHESLSLSAKLTGELMPHAGVTVTNVLLSPDFQRLRSELTRVGVASSRRNARACHSATTFRSAGLSKPRASDRVPPA